MNSEKVLLTKELKDDILKYTRCGLFNRQVCAVLGFSEKTYYVLMNSDPDFDREVKNCKLIADTNIEDSIYQMGLGFHKEEEKVVTLSGGLHSESTYEVVKYKKYHPPSLAAAKHYSNNRNPDRWKEKTELAVKMEDISDAKLEEMVKKLLAGGDEDGINE